MKVRSLHDMAHAIKVAVAILHGGKSWGLRSLWLQNIKIGHEEEIRVTCGLEIAD